MKNQVMSRKSILIFCLKGYERIKMKVNYYLNINNFE